MKTLNSRLYALSIPFTMSFAHSAARRSACDSLIVELNDGDVSGFGEIILREYVNCTAEAYPEPEDVREGLRSITERITGPGGSLPDVKDLRAAVLTDEWQREELPLLAGVEAAVLGLLCTREQRDIYELLGRRPLREELEYGGILPILPEESLERFLYRYRKLGVPNLRVKLGEDLAYNQQVLETARRVLGDRFDLRVDVNGAWDVETALEHLDVLSENGVQLIEEPLGPGSTAMRALADRSAGYPVTYVADESAVSFADVREIISEGSFGMLNIRIAKNGGLLRSMEIAEMAEEAGLGYQLGCHVGETGILSAAGRVAASLMRAPRYVDGSFDELLLTDNITRDSYTFGPGGRAQVVRGRGMGYAVDPEKLEQYGRKIAEEA
jgi:muconate cycloisomerase